MALVTDREGYAYPRREVEAIWQVGGSTGGGSTLPAAPSVALALTL